VAYNDVISCNYIHKDATGCCVGAMRLYTGLIEREIMSDCYIITLLSICVHVLSSVGLYILAYV